MTNFEFSSTIIGKVGNLSEKFSGSSRLKCVSIERAKINLQIKYDARIMRAAMLKISYGRLAHTRFVCSVSTVDCSYSVSWCSCNRHTTYETCVSKATI